MKKIQLIAALAILVLAEYSNASHYETRVVGRDEFGSAVWGDVLVADPWDYSTGFRLNNPIGYVGYGSSVSFSRNFGFGGGYHYQPTTAILLSGHSRTVTFVDRAGRVTTVFHH